MKYNHTIQHAMIFIWRLKATGVMWLLLFLPVTFPALVSAQTVEVWLTLPNQSKTLNRKPDLTFGPGTGAAAYTIDLNHTISYQTVAGIGAAMTDSSAWLIQNAMNQSQRNALMANLFTRNGNGIGLSYLRIPMGASDFALSSYTYDDLPAGQTDPDLNHFSIQHDLAYIIPVLQQAKSLKPKLRFMGSPWSPPAWMKTNNSLYGGALNPDYFVVTIHQATGGATYNVEYYVLGHVSKFVDPEAVRIDSTNFDEGQPENVAFRNPDGSIVLIVHSTAATTFDIQWNGQYVTYSLPAGGGTVTFKTILNSYLLWTK